MPTLEVRLFILILVKVFGVKCCRAQLLDEDFNNRTISNADGKNRKTERIKIY
jgi:hypothetical protein